MSELLIKFLAIQVLVGCQTELAGNDLEAIEMNVGKVQP